MLSHLDTIHTQRTGYEFTQAHSSSPESRTLNTTNSPCVCQTYHLCMMSISTIYSLHSARNNIYGSNPFCSTKYASTHLQYKWVSLILFLSNIRKTVISQCNVRDVLIIENWLAWNISEDNGHKHSIHGSLAKKWFDIQWSVLMNAFDAVQAFSDDFSFLQGKIAFSKCSVWYITKASLIIFLQLMMCCSSAWGKKISLVCRMVPQ